MTFTAGTALIMWMGEHITQKGIGNGISIILFAGIVSRGPSLMRTLGNLFQTGTSGIVSAILMIIIGIFIVVFIVFMSNAERRIPVQYAKRVVGRKMYGGQSTHLPIKVNASGVMPIIFASSILALPQTVSMFWQPEAGTVGAHILNLFSQRSVVYIVRQGYLRRRRIPRHRRSGTADRRCDLHEPLQCGSGRHLGHHRRRCCA